MIKRYCNLFFIILLFSVPVLAQNTAPSTESNGKEIEAIQRLYTLHFWTASSYSLKDDTNRQAIIAFQKLNGLPRNGKLTNSTLSRLARASVPTPHVTMHAPHLEVDLNRQVLFVVDANDQVNRILSVSTGNGKLFNDSGKGMQYALTPRGSFKIYYKVIGWKKSPLGRMFYPMYFSGGFAVHGSNSVPSRPASHGCVRIPMFAAQEMFRVTPVGTPVIVFGENPKPN